MEIPVLASDLIKQLDKSVPKGKLTSSDFSKSERELWFEAGMRNLVDNLLLTLERQEQQQEENLLEGEIKCVSQKHLK